MVEKVYTNRLGFDEQSENAREREHLLQILDAIKSQSLYQLSVKDELVLPIEAYKRYKKSFVENMQFDTNMIFANYSKYDES